MHEEAPSFSFKSLFFPLTTTKAIHWIFFVGIIVFANSLLNGFIADDNGQLLDNQLVHSISNFFSFFSSESFSGGSATGAGIYYKPIFSIVLSIIYSLFGPVPFFYHFTQLLLHIVNASLLFYFFSKIIHKPFALFLALIFLIHPINAESVIYISDMQEVLFFFFGMLSLVLSIKKLASTRSLILIHNLLLFSMLSKETGILFLFISLVYILLFQRKRFKIYATFSLLVIIAYCIFRFLVAGIYFNKDILNPIMEASLSERLLSIPAIFSYYISTFLFPKHLLFNQQWVIQQITFEDFILPLGICLFFITILIGISRKLIAINKQNKPFVLFSLLWFFSGIVLHMQIFPLDATVADRWFYFPMVGLLGLSGLFIQHKYLLWKLKYKKEIFLTAFVVIIILLSIRTIVRNANWYDPITLYIHDLPLMRPNFSIENALVYEYVKVEDKNKAFSHAERSVEIYPTFVNLTNLGALYVEQGQYEKGKQMYNKAIEKGNNYYLAYENFSLLYIKQNDSVEGRLFIKKATKMFPRSKKLWMYRIIAEYRAGNNTDALVAAEHYHALSNTEQSYGILMRLQNKQPLNIQFK